MRQVIYYTTIFGYYLLTVREGSYDTGDDYMRCAESRLACRILFDNRCTPQFEPVLGQGSSKHTQ